MNDLEALPMTLFRRSVRPSFRVGVHTDRGGTHPRNEDACLADPDRGLFAVADGMGGHPAGDVAARTAIDALPRLIEAELGPVRRTAPAIARAVRALNDLVIDRAEADPELSGMGTTLVLVQVVGSTAYLANVGDSRAYLLSGTTFRRLTEDQTYAAELVQGGVLDVEAASRHPFAHAIAHAIGRPDIRPQVDDIELTDGDLLLLCSDGLTKSLTDERIATLLTEIPDPEQAGPALVDAARDAGELDDISVVVVRCGNLDA